MYITILSIVSEEYMKRIVVDIEDKLHREFKGFCYTHGRTVKDVIIEFMESKTKKKGGSYEKKRK